MGHGSKYENNMSQTTSGLDLGAVRVGVRCDLGVIWLRCALYGLVGVVWVVVARWGPLQDLWWSMW